MTNATTSLTITPETEQQISAALKAANGKRRERLLSLATVLSLAEKVAAGSPHAFENAGSVANAYKYPADTTVALAVAVDGKLYVGVGVSPATSPSPGRAWAQLKPWNASRDQTDKLRRWVSECSPVLVCSLEAR